MLGWLYVTLERWVCARSSRLDRFCRRIPRGYVQRLSEAKLVRTLRYAWRRSPAQRERWRNAGVKFRDLRSANVLRHIPFMTGSDLVERPEAFFCVPEDELIHMVGSSGTTGAHKRIFLTQEDLEHQVCMLGALVRRFPGVKRAAAMLLLDDPSWCAGTIARRSFEEARVFGLLANTSRDIHDQVELLRNYHIDLLMSTPAYVHRLALESHVPVSELGLKYLMVGGQSFTETFRAEMEAAWGAKLINSYASAETLCGLASECPVQDGLHVAEGDHWLEIVDPTTGEVLDEGDEGEIVMTTLSRRGMPLVRYRTKDLASFLPRGERCACGMPLRKISRIRGRTDDMLIIGTGNNVYPDEVDAAVLAIPGVTDYQLTVEKDGYRDVVHLVVESSDGLDTLKSALFDALMQVNSIRVSHDHTKTLTVGRLEVVRPGELSQGRPKTRRIVDRRATGPS